MKRIISFFLLLVFAFNLVGVAILFKVQQYSVKQEIKRQIQRGVPEAELCAIRVDAQNDAEVWWLEEDEFFYRGAMYDVVKKRDLGKGETVYFCINDVLEKKLYDNLDALVGKHPPGSKHLGDIAKKLVDFLASLYFLEKDSFTFHRTFISAANWFLTLDYASVFLSLSSPPPQMPWVRA